MIVIVTENKDLKVLWDITVQTDKHLQHNLLHIVIVHKGKKVCNIVDFTCPGDCRVESKE